MDIFKNKKEIEDLKKKYYVEEILFNEIGPNAKKRGYLTKKEFLAICLWKTPRAKKRYLSNTQKKIESITKKAFSEKEETNKIQKLCELSGVGVPVASALLTVVYPEDYGVIDIRCMQMLKMKNNYPKVTDWLEYLNKIREIRKKHKIENVRFVEQALFAKHREEHPENLYGVIK